MAQITHVKRAHQRFEQVPVLDETGQPKRTPVMVTQRQHVEGITMEVQVQKTDKRGRPVFMSVTVADKTKPLPMPKCDACREEIQVGTPYKHISPKSGPYGGRTLTRHEDCPTWNVWEYSSSLSARIAQIQATDVDVSAVMSEDDVRDALSDIISDIQSLAEEKREGAENIENGFGHETESSMALNEVADGLDEWADGLDSLDVPEFPEVEPRWFVLVNGVRPEGDDFETEGYDSDIDAQTDIDAYIEEHPEAKPEDFDIEEITDEEPTEDQLNDWRSEVETAIADAIGDCNVG